MSPLLHWLSVARLLAAAIGLSLTCGCGPAKPASTPAPTDASTATGPAAVAAQTPEGNGEDWAVYVTESGDGPSSVLVNLMAAKYQAGRPERCLVRIALRTADQNGFPLEAEDAQLYPIEDTLAVLMCTQFKGTYVGRQTTAGTQTFCYYLPENSGISAEKTREAVRNWPGYVVTFTLVADKEWRYFHEHLYPDRDTLNSITNRNVVDNLLESGDTLEAPRETDHWIYFRTTKARSAYRDAVVAIAFKVRKESTTDDGLYGLQIFRVDHVDQQSIDAITLTLMHLADNHDGDYDGWETFVVTAGEEPGTAAPD